jgi:hypothetical protein
MRAAILAQVEAGGAGLEPLVRQAIGTIESGQFDELVALHGDFDRLSLGSE